MGLYGMMRTGVSGMNAQTTRLSSIADNIANVATTGYKRSSIEFSSLILPTTTGSYNSGAVLTDIRRSVSEQGAITYTNSKTNLAINGQGFFVVSGGNGQTYLTRAGNFEPNGNGELVNASGNKLMAYPYKDDQPSITANGFMSMQVVRLAGKPLMAKPTTKGVFAANLDAGRDYISGDSAASNAADAEYTHKSSIKAYDSLGNKVVYDLYFTKLADNQWEVAAYNSADRDPTSGGFPYGGDALLSSATLDFDPSTGKLTDTSEDALELPDGVPSNMKGFSLDLGSMTQLSHSFSVDHASVNGSAPSQVTDYGISGDGVVYASYDNGEVVPLYQLATAMVASPDNLTAISGDLFQLSGDSGDVVMGIPGSDAHGSLISGALESSNVDLANELTDMIQSQRTYTANSKVFQTGSELMETLINLKR